jgi:hypothetical protein
VFVQIAVVFNFYEFKHLIISKNTKNNTYVTNL